MSLSSTSRRRHVFACLCLLPFAASALPETGTVIAPQAPFVEYTTVDGLTQAQVNGIAQDRAGYLWITTLRGLNRFDGREFVHLTIADGLPTNELTAIETAADGTVLVGNADGEVSVVRNGRVDFSVSAPPGMRGSVEELAVGADTVYVRVGDGGLAAFDYERAAPQMTPVLQSTRPVQDIVVTGERLWFVMDGVLHVHDLVPGKPAAFVLDEVVRSTVDSVGRHWLLRADGRAGLFVDGGRFEPANVAAKGAVLDLAVGPDGTLWMLTAESLTGVDSVAASLGEPARIQRYPNVDGAQKLFVDRESTVWLSAESRLLRLLGDRFRHYDLRTGPGSHTVWAIAGDAGRNLYFGTQETLLRFSDDGLLLDVGALAGLPRGHVRDVVSDGGNTLWVGIRDHGLYRFDAKSLTARRIAGTEGLNILDVVLARDGAIWVATFDFGVFAFDPATDELHQLPTPNGSSVFAIAAADDGSVWYGADDAGLVQLRPDGAGGYSETLFGANAGLSDVSFNHLRPVAGGAVWIGAIDGDLIRFEGGETTNIGPATPLADQSVYIVEPVGDGTLIVGGELGLYLIDPGTGHASHFGALDGFVALETNAHASYRDADGFLWLGTIDGATRMNTELPALAKPDLNPMILRMQSDRRRVDVANEQAIPWAHRDIATNFVAVSLREPRAIEYSYQLIGLHDDWLPPATNSTVEFGGLPPGDYEFRVRARYPGENWSPLVAKQRFTVLKPFWLTGWFIGLVVVATLLTIHLVMRLRTRQIAAANRRLREQVHTRTASIARANSQLAASNRQLEKEMAERRKSDAARAEVESRLKLAFQNTPIGMAVLAADSSIEAVNPALRRLLWPALAANDDPPPFFESVGDESRAELAVLMDAVVNGETESGSADAVCVNSDGRRLQTTITLTGVREADGEFRYALLHVQDITEARELTNLLEAQANFDELTGLLNRRAFEAELAAVRASAADFDEPSYLLFMDLDRFKIVNDTSGHGAGDEMLRQVAEIMRAAVRSEDIIGRLGGDEFGLIIRNCPQSGASRIAEAIRRAIEDFRFQWAAETHRIGISIGAVPIDGRLGEVGELEQLADAACYDAKHEGRNCVRFVDGPDGAATLSRGEARWVQRLRDAMDERRFALYGQIIKPLRRRHQGPEIVEVLLRMRDVTTRKLIPPGAFLPAAERYGLSAEIDEWVVSNLLDMLHVHDAFGVAERCYWVNLSGASIGNPRFAEFLVDAVSRSELPAGMLNFEITETAVIRNIAQAGELMLTLKNMGCMFALDDFGSGLSSFGHLKKLPVDCVKIDGMFIRDILTDEMDRIFVKSIIDIAATMGVSTVAEFVENNAILAVVRELGADFAQGFGVHRPELIAPQFPGGSVFRLGAEDIAEPDMFVRGAP